MLDPLVTQEFEEEILELIDDQDKYTRSDLQGLVTLLVLKILRAGKKMPAEK